MQDVLMNIMDRAMEAQNSATSSDFKKILRSKEKPDPLPCRFCGEGIHYSSVGEALNTTFWLFNKRCPCDLSTQHWTKVDAEKARKEEEVKRAEFDQKRRETLEKLFRSSQLPSRFMQRTFANFKVSTETKLGYDTAKNYADHFVEMKAVGRGLSFGGLYGTGKTHLAASISLQLLNDCHSVVFGTVSTLLGRLKDTYDDESKVTERQVLDELIRCELLVLDDLGKEKATPWVEEKLYEIINTRYENNKCLIITTNIQLSELDDVYKRNGGAIASRIVEMCDGVKMTGQDYRLYGA